MTVMKLRVDFVRRVSESLSDGWKRRGMRKRKVLKKHAGNGLEQLCG